MRSASINLRAMPSQRNLIDHAAFLLGKTRSEFMLDIACAYAQDVILEQTLFPLQPAQFEQFVQLLEQPIQQNEGLEALLATSSPWENK